MLTVGIPYDVYPLGGDDPCLFTTFSHRVRFLVPCMTDFFTVFMY